MYLNYCEYCFDKYRNENTFTCMELSESLIPPDFQKGLKSQHGLWNFSQSSPTVSWTTLTSLTWSCWLLAAEPSYYGPTKSFHSTHRSMEPVFWFVHSSLWNSHKQSSRKVFPFPCVSLMLLWHRLTVQSCWISPELKILKAASSFPYLP